ncbi:MAG: hybrid sensor histidine kinase/response regulator [Gammaproteobacteria bacterium]|jgi:PAS domain S-box-containing protein
MVYTSSNDTPQVDSHFRQLYEEAPLPYQSLDSSGRLLEVNPAWEEAFGYTREEVLGRYIGDFHVSGQGDKLRQGFSDFLQHDSINAVEFEFKCKNGTRKLMSVSGRIVRDAHGEFQRTHCILIDITERKIYEAALHESEEKYRLAMEATQDGLWDWYLTTGKVSYSPSWGRILGEEIVDGSYSSWEDRIHPDDRPHILQSLYSHLAGELPAWSEEHRLRNVDNDYIWVLGRGRVVERDLYGKPLRMVGTMTDINARKQIEEALYKSEQKLRALINAATDDVVVLLDRNFKLEIVNKRAAKGFQGSVEQIQGRALDELVSGSLAKNRKMYAGEVFSNGESVRFEDHRAGYWYDNNMCPVVDSKGNVEAVAIFARDITERKKMENALNKAKRAAEDANASKTRFLAAASHDMRQPLQAITANTDLLALTNTDPALFRPIKQLRDASQALQDMLEGLLDISNLDTGILLPDLSAFPIGALLEQLSDQFQSLAMSNELILELKPCDAVVKSDRTLLRVILQNLISNAIKYTRQGSVVIGCERCGDLLRIEVRDSGMGIPESMQEIIFEEFYQLNNQSRDRGRGTGIGLAIVKRITDLLNHPISVHSVEGEGSSFEIHVPLADGKVNVKSSGPPLTAVLNKQSTSASILLIDDDAIVLDANRLLLTTLGYTVISAPNAQTAMDLIGSELPSPDLIIADYRLPGECMGTELVQNIRAIADTLIPAIILTGDITLPREANTLLENSILLQKPAHIDELDQTIKLLLGEMILANQDETAAE